MEGVVQGVVGTIAGLAPIPGPLLSQLAPLTSPLNALLRQALERGDATALSTAIVTAGRAIIALLVKAALPVLPPIRPVRESLLEDSDKKLRAQRATGKTRSDCVDMSESWRVG